MLSFLLPCSSVPNSFFHFPFPYHHLLDFPLPLFLLHLHHLFCRYHHLFHYPFHLHYYLLFLIFLCHCSHDPFPFFLYHHYCHHHHCCHCYYHHYYLDLFHCYWNYVCSIFLVCPFYSY